MKIAEKLKVALKKMLALELGRVSTDKGELVYDGELAVGVEVFIEDEAGELQPAPDGEYATENSVIVVKEGKVAEIKENEPKNAEPAEEESNENAPEEPNDENVEAEQIDEPAAESAEAPAEEEAEQESIEDKVARLEGLVNGFVEGVEKIVNAIAALEDRVAELENKVKDLDNEPAAEPAEAPAPEEEVTNSRLAYLRKNK